MENYAWPTIWDFFDRSLYSLQQRQQVLKFNMSFHDSVKKNFSKHHSKIKWYECKNLKSLAVIFQAIKNSPSFSVMKVGSNTFGDPIFQKGLQN